MVDFPLMQPALKINFMVTMWDTPESNGGGVGGVLSSVGSAAMNLAVPFLTGGFKKVEGLTQAVKLENYHEGGHNNEQYQFFNYAEFPVITFSRGITFNTDIWDWHHQVTNGERKVRKSGTIILLDTKKLFLSGEDDTKLPPNPIQFLPIASWTFHNALPKKIAIPDLNAGAKEEDAVAIEKMELQPERIERLSLALIPGVADLNSALSGLIGMAPAIAGAGLAAGGVGHLGTATADRGLF